MTLTLQRRLAEHLAAAEADAEALHLAEAWTLAACRRRDAIFLAAVLQGRIIAPALNALALDGVRAA